MAEVLSTIDPGVSIHLLLSHLSRLYQFYNASDMNIKYLTVMMVLPAYVRIVKLFLIHKASRKIQRVVTAKGEA